MWVNTYVHSAAQIDECAASEQVKEVLLEPQALCRRGFLSMIQVLALSIYAHTKGLQTVLVWDIMMTESAMDNALQLLATINLDFFDAIRVTDPGALQWLLERGVKKQIHINCENANNNLMSIQNWCEYVKSLRGRYPERVLLSLELTETKICDYCRKLAVPCEYLGAGHIEIFQSMRPLLSRTFCSEGGEERIEAVVSSYEMGDRPLVCLETAYGTLLYLDKDQFVLDKLQGLIEAGLHTLRIDLRDHSWKPGIAFYAQGVCQGFANDIPWPRKTAAPFFAANKSTDQFEYLKRNRAKRKKEKVVAEVIAAEKDRFVVFDLKKAVALEGIFSVCNSLGKELFRGEIAFRNSHGERIHKAESRTLLFSDWISGTQTGAKVFIT